MIAGAAEIDDLLGAAYRFHPEFVFGDQNVGAWLPELEVHALGATLDEALAELADVVVEYAEDWQSDLRLAPNHRARAGYVRRVQIAGGAAGVLAMLERDADVASADEDSAASGESLAP